MAPIGQVKLARLVQAVREAPGMTKRQIVALNNGCGPITVDTAVLRGLIELHEGKFFVASNADELLRQQPASGKHTKWTQPRQFKTARPEGRKRSVARSSAPAETPLSNEMDPQVWKLLTNDTLAKVFRVIRHTSVGEAVLEEILNRLEKE